MVPHRGPQLGGGLRLTSEQGPMGTHGGNDRLPWAPASTSQNISKDTENFAT